MPLRAHYERYDRPRRRTRQMIRGLDPRGPGPDVFRRLLLPYRRWHHARSVAKPLRRCQPMTRRAAPEPHAGPTTIACPIEAQAGSVRTWGFSTRICHARSRSFASGGEEGSSGRRTSSTAGFPSRLSSRHVHRAELASSALPPDTTRHTPRTARPLCGPGPGWPRPYRQTSRHCSACPLCRRRHTISRGLHKIAPPGTRSWRWAAGCSRSAGACSSACCTADCSGCCR
jgi:hypothetical protein